MMTRRVMGIDPGLMHCGWGVVDMRGNHMSYVACGRHSTKPGVALADRLLNLYDGLTSMMEQWAPDEVAVEHTFVNKDAVATLKLGHARAITLLVPRQLGIPVSEYAPNHVKKAVVGVGHAGKQQVQDMVKRLLPGANFKSPDAADALAIAICHGHQNPIMTGRVAG